MLNFCLLCSVSLVLCSFRTFESHFKSFLCRNAENSKDFTKKCHCKKCFKDLILSQIIRLANCLSLCPDSCSASVIAKQVKCITALFT